MSVISKFLEPGLELVVDPLIPSLEGLSEQHGDYRAFAQTTYGSAREQIAKALTQSPDMPVFVGSFETHYDSKGVARLDALTSDLEESPAVAAAVTHIAALQAAVDLVGKENVVLDVELNEKTLKEYIDNRNNYASLGLTLDPGHQSMFHIINYALDHGIKINPSDILHDAPDAVEGQTRYDAELESVRLQALYTRDAPRVLVHVGGAGHLGNFQGFSQSEMLHEGSGLDRSQRVNPLEGIYGAEVFLHTPNTTHWLLDSDRREDYASDPANAMQIDSPGRMSEADRTQLGQYVLAASNAAQAATNPQTTAPQTAVVAPAQSLK